MTDLNLVVKQIESELKFNELGVATVTISGAARLSGVTQQALSKSLSTDTTCKPSKLAQSLCTNGFNTHNLNEGIPDSALAIILSYYGYEAGKYCTEIAKQCCLAFMSRGISNWLQEMTGWQSPQTVTNHAMAIADVVMVEMRRVNELHPVTCKVITQMIIDEFGGTVVSQNDLNASLTANRLGLAFNKQIKAFERLSSETSPEAFINLKEAYLSLAEQHAELLEAKTPRTNVETIIKEVEVLRQNPEHEKEMNKLNNLLLHKEKEINSLEKEVNNLNQQISHYESVLYQREYNITRLEKIIEQQPKPQADKRFLLPGS